MIGCVILIIKEVARAAVHIQIGRHKCTNPDSSRYNSLKGSAEVPLKVEGADACIYTSDRKMNSSTGCNETSIFFFGGVLHHVALGLAVDWSPPGYPLWLEGLKPPVWFIAYCCYVYECIDFIRILCHQPTTEEMLLHTECGTHYWLGGFQLCSTCHHWPHWPPTSFPCTLRLPQPLLLTSLPGVHLHH